ncbi:hypothetical protein KJ644_01175 [Candidatus Dependentiae bacterium]|nr:hypothetical protein [Candidatus Dependentiae bacterium]MBU4387062.1 hypothetical protein [Candidatus Dependentiae bacterium]MCG2755910.1 hypothetical protein [Candidatus Dependentiae bacterium]
MARKESDINELIFRITVILILLLAFKPFYLYIHSTDNKEQVKQEKESVIAPKIIEPKSLNESVNTNTKDKIVFNNNLKLLSNNNTKTLNSNNGNKKNIKKIVIRNNNKNGKQVLTTKKTADNNNNAEQINNYVEKINAYIEEQDFLLSSIDVENENMPVILDTIKNNLDEIEKQAEQNKISNLINNTKINELKTNIESYKQVIEQVKNL